MILTIWDQKFGLVVQWLNLFEFLQDLHGSGM